MNPLHTWFYLLKLLLWPPALRLFCRQFGRTEQRLSAVEREVERHAKQAPTPGREWTPEERDAYFGKIPGDDCLVRGIETCGCDESLMLRERLKENAALREACERWRDKVRPHAPESCYDNDRVFEKLPALAEAVCDVIGYADVWPVHESVTLS